MSMTKNSPAYLAAYHNEDDGIEAQVHAADRGGFNITVRDTDADEFFPCVFHRETFEDAKAKAAEVLDHE